MPNNTKVGIVKIYNKNGQYSAHMRYEVDGVESFRTEQLIKNPIPYIQQFTSSIESKQSESKSQIEYVSTDENWSEEQIKDWMKANSPQYKYKTGKWQVIRRNGKLQAAQKLAKRGLTSQVKGEGKLSVDEARQWLQDKLGIDKSDIVTSEAVFRMANAPQVYGALKVCMDRLSSDTAARIFLSEQSGQGVEFHEGFHYVSQLLINDKLREQVYQDYVKHLMQCLKYQVLLGMEIQ